MKAAMKPLLARMSRGHEGFAVPDPPVSFVNPICGVPEIASLGRGAMQCTAIRRRLVDHAFKEIQGRHFTQQVLFTQECIDRHRIELSA